MALTDDIQGYWKFDESSGNASDSTPNNNDLTNNNTATFVPAVIANGCDLERGSSQYFSITNAALTGLNFSDPLTFAGWVNFETVDNASSFVTKRAGGDTRQYFFRMNLNTHLRLVTDLDGGVTNIYVAEVPWTPSTGVWYHIAVTKSGTTIKFYIDGTQSGGDQTIANGGIFSGPGDYAMGATPTDGEFSDQKMDEWGVWSRPLSGAEIAQLYNGGAGLTYPFVSPGPANVKTFDGVTQSTGVKTYMGVALADTKTVDGIA